MFHRGGFAARTPRREERPERRLAGWLARLSLVDRLTRTKQQIVASVKQRREITADAGACRRDPYRESVKEIRLRSEREGAPSKLGGDFWWMDFEDADLGGKDRMDFTEDIGNTYD